MDHGKGHSPGEEDEHKHELQVHLEELALVPSQPHPVHEDGLQLQRAHTDKHRLIHHAEK